MQKIFIDCFNLSVGGGLTHLLSVLREADPSALVYCSTAVAKKVRALHLKNVQVETHWMLDKNILIRLFWHVFLSKSEFRRSAAVVAFYPGGICASGVRPFVTMSRNMLPFTWSELVRLKSFKLRIKLILVRWAQIFSFQRAAGVIFLTEYAARKLRKYVSDTTKVTVVGHGCSVVRNVDRGKESLKSQVSASCEMLYVSHFTTYKNHLNLLKAFNLVSAAYPNLRLHLVGSFDESYGDCADYVEKHESLKGKVVFHGELTQVEVLAFYESCDCFIFASSCENYPNIINEVLTYAPSILSSFMTPMPALLQERAIYFNPLYVADIERALLYFLSGKHRSCGFKTQSRFNQIDRISWDVCASRTFSFVLDC